MATLKERFEKLQRYAVGYTGDALRSADIDVLKRDDVLALVDEVEREEACCPADDCGHRMSDHDETGCRVGIESGLGWIECNCQNVPPKPRG